MKRFLAAIAAAIVLSVSAAYPAALQGAAVDSIMSGGVSAQLARIRKSCIDSLRYDMLLSIPASRAERVTGVETITFNYRKGASDMPLLLDFTGGAGSVASLEVNGSPTEPDCRNEHIVIPAGMMRDGRNEIKVAFTAGDRSLNRRDDLMYTLFVPDRARTVFPCFDQPDLKASYTLALEIPEEWKAVSNTSIVSEGKVGERRRRIEFGPTEPLSTYLFAFSAGRFEHESHERDGMTIGVYHRETDSLRVSQIPDICDIVFNALRWQEEFTGCRYPFAKYDLVILPGFQFGGMEHTGATFYNDGQTFLSANPTAAEILRRTQLIAHETTHMWFGDYITMKWFNDVWTKEVFANYFGAEITRELLPEYNHDLEWMRTYMGASLAEDRTSGGTAIRQNLDNMQDAGLIYNNIIYNKAPVMLVKLVEFIGRDAFRDAIRDYVAEYGYGNATWDDLVEIFGRHTDKDVKAFSDVWVYRPGLPTVDLAIDDGTIVARQVDPRGNGSLWPQSFDVWIGNENGGRHIDLTFEPGDSVLALPLPDGLPAGHLHIIPDSDGRGYGLFRAPAPDRKWLMEQLAAGDVSAFLSSEGELAAMLNLNECWMARLIETDEWLGLLLGRLADENNDVAASALTGYLAMPLADTTGESRERYEAMMLDMALNHRLSSVRTAMTRLLVNSGETDVTMETLDDIWEEGKSDVLSEADFMNLAYALAAAFPERYEEIIATQRSRLSNPDRIRQFDFVSRAVAPTRDERDQFFTELLDSRNREVEPWTLKALGLLNKPRNVGETAGYIRAALEALPDVKRTGDIFFPASWSRTLLSDYRNEEARREVENYLATAGLIPLLRNKVLIAAYPLFR